MVLILVLSVSSGLDYQLLRIPKWLTISLLFLGLVANVVRGVLLSQIGQQVWLVNSPSRVVGALDGLAFSLCGAIVGFLIFFVFWRIRICGGGDVKLITAVGAWIGPEIILYIIALSMAFILLWVLLLLVIRFLPNRSETRNQPSSPLQESKRPQSPASRAAPFKPVRGRQISYSTSVALATLLMMLMLWQRQLFP